MKISDLLEKDDTPGFIKKWIGDPLQGFIDRAQKKTGYTGPADKKVSKEKPTPTPKKQKVVRRTRGDTTRSQRLPRDLNSLPNRSSYVNDAGDIVTWYKTEGIWRNQKGDTTPSKQGWREFVQAHKSGKATISMETIGESVLLEGGNIFKDPETKEPVTKRIARDDVDPTLAWVEKITGIPHRDFKLGSTGIRSTSGDLDVAVNQAEVDKEELYQKLVAWAQKNHPDDDVRQWVAKSGINVHFKTPINGDEAQGFVQTDLMFGDPEFMKFALKGMGDNTPFKGADRMILIASVAKAKGMKWSPTNGLVNRETNEPITKVPNEVAELILGKGSTANDMDSVERMIEKLKTQPNFDALTADFKDNLAKRGMEMPEDYALQDIRKLAGV